MSLAGGSRRNALGCAVAFDRRAVLGTETIEDEGSGHRRRNSGLQRCPVARRARMGSRRAPTSGGLGRASNIEGRWGNDSRAQNCDAWACRAWHGIAPAMKASIVAERRGW